MRFGGLEAGGTKMVCAVADENGTILDRMSIPTKQPEETIPALEAYFRTNRVDALGIGSFGPVDLDERSSTYGCLLRTPKPGWAGLNVLSAFADELKIPVGIDTDVNGAVLGEVTYGAAKNCSTAVYMTVGTGIGCGVYVEGRLLHGMLHPEAGHMLVARHPSDTYAGCCSIHGDCLEGLASGPAIKGRWGKPGSDLYDVDEVWRLEAYYLGQALANIVLCYAPEKIILGGGVMHKDGLVSRAAEEMRSNLNGYVARDLLNAEEYVVSPGCGDNAGILGAIRLGMLKAGL